MAAPAHIKIDVVGEQQYNELFFRLDAVFDDLLPIWPDVRDEFWQIEREQFDSEGSAGRYGKWKELSERYRMQKIKQYGEQPIMRASGNLYNAMTGQTDNTVYRATRDEMSVGTNLPYAKRHQTGGKNLPQRRLVDLSDEQKMRLRKTIQKALVRELRKGKFDIK